MNTNKTKLALMLSAGLAVATSASLIAVNSYADDSNDRSLRHMKADADVSNRSANKSAVFHVEDESNTSNEASNNENMKERDLNTTQYDDSAILKNETVHFEFDSAELTSDAKQELETMVSAFDAEKVESIDIVGYTDAIGPESYNEMLAEERAQAVKNYLMSEGVRRSAFDLEAEGEAAPIASNDSAEGRAQNRRVEIKVDLKDESRELSAVTQ